MNGDALSDLLLAAISLIIAWRLVGTHPGVGVGAMLIGIAALLGVPDYLGIVQTRGPHHLASLVAACAGLPLIAISVGWPRDAIARRIGAAARFAVLAGGISILLVGVLGFSLLGQVLPALSAMVLVFAAVRSRRTPAICASAVLVCAFVTSAAGWIVSPFNSVQQLHLLMAVWLLLMAIDHASLACQLTVIDGESTLNGDDTQVSRH